MRIEEKGMLLACRLGGRELERRYVFFFFFPMEEREREKEECGEEEGGEAGRGVGGLCRGTGLMWGGGVFRLLLRINLIRLRDLPEWGLNYRANLYITIVRWRLVDHMKGCMYMV